MGFALLALCLVVASAASAQPMRVLWWDVSLPEAGNQPSNRQTMARFMDGYQGGALFDVEYVFEPRGGAFARHMAANPNYKMIVMTATNFNGVFNQADLDAFRSFYASGTKALMLDGTLGIRNYDRLSLTKWPGPNNVLANTLVNQMEALRLAGGGLLIGTDHGRFQNAANRVVAAILPQAQFTRTTDPSRDGDFFGEVLLAQKEQIKPLDLLRHWEAVPSQGQAPVGTFTDFRGQPVTLYTLVEASDKPGGGTRRPYISSTIDPGDTRYDIAEDAAPVINRMPTRKSLPRN